MISTITVNGYRSLQQFSLDLSPGLNVLVGPNAAGKSNIVSFFNFLRLLVDNRLADAIAMAGGAASVFAKINETEYQRNLSSSISGTFPDLEKQYRYAFTIELTQTNHQIYFSTQQLSVGSEVDGKFKEELSISVEAVVHQDEKISVTSNTLGLNKETSLSDMQLNKFLERIFSSADQSLIRVSQFLPLDEEAISLVNADFLGTSVFNVIPSSVKTAEDTVRRPGIGPDGSGVAASIRALEMGDVFYAPRGPFYAALPKAHLKDAKTTLGRIVDTVRLAVPRIADITVKGDPFSPQLQCNVDFYVHEGSDSRIRLPLAQVSDGTAKWIAIVTAIFTSESGVSLEEPENFLHPHMQREIVQLMRENCTQRRFVLLTTHSETVLNAVRPDEVILVEHRDGRTTAGRVKNSKEIREEINRTGFGLGYYYFAQAMES